MSTRPKHRAVVTDSLQMREAADAIQAARVALEVPCADGDGLATAVANAGVLVPHGVSVVPLVAGCWGD